MHRVSPEDASGRHGAGGWARRALAPLAAAHARHRDAVRLAGLSDHLLVDIGLNRDAVRGGRPISDGR
jgi:uncharacterized protein YjiS (DUF1127 family)